MLRVAAEALGRLFLLASGSVYRLARRTGLGEPSRELVQFLESSMELRQAGRDPARRHAAERPAGPTGATARRQTRSARPGRTPEGRGLLPSVPARRANSSNNSAAVPLGTACGIWPPQIPLTVRRAKVSSGMTRPSSSTGNRCQGPESNPAAGARINGTSFASVAEGRKPRWVEGHHAKHGREPHQVKFAGFWWGSLRSTHPSMLRSRRGADGQQGDATSDDTAVAPAAPPKQELQKVVAEDAADDQQAAEVLRAAARIVIYLQHGDRTRNPPAADSAVSWAPRPRLAAGNGPADLGLTEGIRN